MVHQKYYQIINDILITLPQAVIHRSSYQLSSCCIIKQGLSKLMLIKTYNTWLGFDFDLK